MGDVALQSYEIAAEALGAQRDACGRYSEVVDAQHAAFRSGNLALVLELSKRLDTIIAEMSVQTTLLEPVSRKIRSSEVNGPRTRTLIELMTVTATEAALVQANINNLGKRITADRDLLAEQLDHLGASAPGSRTSRGRQHPGAAVIDTRA